MRVIIKTSRPGMIIGRQGEGATKLRESIVKFMKRAGIFPKEDIRIDIQEISALMLMHQLLHTVLLKQWNVVCLSAE